MMSRKSLFLFIMLVPLVASVCWGQVTLPTWPQSFSIAAGEWASYAIPVTQAGTVTVDVIWTGVPLDITIRNGAGNVVSQSGANIPGKAQLTYNATAADAAAGILWTVYIKDAKPAAPTGILVRTVAVVKKDPKETTPPVAAAGTVSAKYPEIDAAAVQAQAAQLRARFSSQSASAQTVLNQRIAARIKQQEQQQIQARQTKNTAITTQLMSRLQGTILQVTTGGVKRPPLGTLATESGTTAQLMTGNQPAVGSGINVNPALLAAASTPAGKPSITKLTPNIGYYLDTVTIGAQYITPFVNSVQVWFVFNNSVEVQTKVLNVRKSTDGINIDAQVPTTPAGTVVNKTKIYVMAVDQAPAYPTNSLPFDYQQALAPQVTGMDKNKVGPGFGLVIQGRNFMQNSQVHFAPSPGQDIAAKPYFYDPTNLQVYVPNYQLAQSGPGQIYVTSDVVPTAAHPGPATLQSNMMSATFVPTKSTITGIDRNIAEPGETVLISGTGFFDPWVYWNPDKGQESKMINSNTGTDWKVLSYTETGIVAQIPESIKGVVDTLNGKIIVQNRTAAWVEVPFQLKPLIVVKPLLRPKLAYTSFRQHEGNDRYSMGGSVWVYGMHSSGFFEGHRGDEYYEAQMGLINGWVPDHVEVDSNNTEHKGARAVTAGIDPYSNFLYGSVHWWVDAPLDFTYYGVTIYIRGPQGVPYMVPYNECEF
jgi:hypothetical protein